MKINCLKESIQGAGTRTKLFNSRKLCAQLQQVGSTFLELNKLCPRPTSLYAFFEEIDLQREYSVKYEE
jgi:hypothetical protein